MTQVAAIQLNSQAEVAANLAITAELIAQAAAAGAKLIVLPENFALLTQEPSAILAAREPSLSGPLQDFLAQQAQHHKIWLVGGTIPLQSPQPDKAYSACLVYDDQGNQITHYEKMHLFDVAVSKDEIYRESATFAPGNQVAVITTPFGKLGLAICYDVRFPELFKLMLQQGVEIIALSAAFTVPTGHAHWEILVRARAIDTFAYVIAAAQWGAHPHNRHTYGHSMIVAPGGAIIAQLAEGTGFITAPIELAHVHDLRRNIPIMQHQRIRCDI